jgi:PST family polysaccharide transporter
VHCKLKFINAKVSQYNTLIENFGYLSALQVFNMILPLITYPYLIKVLGKETYGLIAFAQAVIDYLTILVGFGFNISATKEVSINRENKDKLNEIVSSILILKCLLVILSFIILGVLLIIIPQAHGYEVLFMLCMWTCLYDIIFPIWYFQGIEQMKYITYITLISRLTFLGLIFMFIHSSEDFLFVPITYGIGAIFAGIISLYIVFKKKQVKFILPAFNTLKYYFIYSSPIFISNVSAKLYVSMNKVIVGVFLGMREVAYYDLAEKIITILKTPQVILSQSLFPKISKEKDLNFIKRIFTLSTGVNIIMFLGILIFSKYIILGLGGEQMLPALNVVNILAITIPVIAMSNIFAIQLLIPFGYNKAFSRVIVTSGFIYLFQIIVFWKLIGFNIINISLVTVITEIFVTTYAFYFCKKYHLWN